MNERANPRVDSLYQKQYDRYRRIICTGAATAALGFGLSTYTMFTFPRFDTPPEIKNMESIEQALNAPLTLRDAASGDATLRAQELESKLVELSVSPAYMAAKKEYAQQQEALDRFGYHLLYEVGVLLLGGFSAVWGFAKLVRTHLSHENSEISQTQS